MDEAHAKTPVKSRQQMIDDERVREREERERCKEERKKRKKKRKKKDNDDDDDEEDDSTYHPSQDQGDKDEEWLPSKGELKRADKEGDY